MTRRKFEPTITRTPTGYRADHSEFGTFVLYYDQHGNYLGQVQDLVDGDGTIFLAAEIVDGVPCVDGEPMTPMSEEEMARAQ